MDNLKFVEIWKPCPDYTDSYQVSSLGRVRSIDRYKGNKKSVCKGKILKQYKNKKGYLEVRLYKNSKSTFKVIHRLVSLAFLPIIPNKNQVNHIDGNKLNNIVTNLEWVNNSDNQKHAYKLKLNYRKFGEINPNSKIKTNDVIKIKNLYNSGKKISEISELTGFSVCIISNIVFGKTWKNVGEVLTKRDDRKFKSECSIKKSLNTKKLKGILGREVIQVSLDGKEINKFRSINNASIMTGIPRKSIEAVVTNKKFFSKDGKKFWTMKTAGNFKWKNA